MRSLCIKVNEVLLLIRRWYQGSLALSKDSGTCIYVAEVLGSCWPRCGVWAIYKLRGRRTVRWFLLLESGLRRERS